MRMTAIIYVKYLFGTAIKKQLVLKGHFLHFEKKQDEFLKSVKKNFKLSLAKEK